MDKTQRDRTIGFLCLVVTAFGWALNWPLMKLLLQQWPPLFARGLAGTCAAVILGTLALARGQLLAVPREALPRLLFASFTNVGWALRPPMEPTFTRRVLLKRELGHAQGDRAA
jgi:drug/metabolite transporter (DMT)-like permease